jgi:hypothetical protein
MRATLFAAAVGAILALGPAPTFASSSSIEEHCADLLAKDYDRGSAEWQQCEFRSGLVGPGQSYHRYAPAYGYGPAYGYEPYGYGVPPE